MLRLTNPFRNIQAGHVCCKNHHYISIDPDNFEELL
jgi:hypothetical protein